MYTGTMAPLSETVLEEMTKTIVETTKPRKVILFGNRARGEAREDSDVDMLVIEDEPFGVKRNRRKEMARLWHALSRFDAAKTSSSMPATRWKDGRTAAVTL